MDEWSVTYAVRISPEAQTRLRAAARVPEDIGYQDVEQPLHQLREQTRQLTGLELEDLVKPSEVVSRRPYICRVCGQGFTISEFNETNWNTRVDGDPSPFELGEQVHLRCV